MINIITIILMIIIIAIIILQAIKIKKISNTINNLMVFRNNTLKNIRQTKINKSEINIDLYKIKKALFENKIIKKDDITLDREEVKKIAFNNPNLSKKLGFFVFDGKVKENNFVCGERTNICNSKCCFLSFPLTIEEIKNGIVEWDETKPFMIKQKDGHCVHLIDNKCSIYNDRPLVCKNYHCENDKRIWKDFDKKKINLNFNNNRRLQEDDK